MRSLSVSLPLVISLNWNAFDSIRLETESLLRVRFSGRGMERAVVIINRVRHQLVGISINRASEARVLARAQPRFRLSAAFDDCAFHHSINQPSRSWIATSLNVKFHPVMHFIKSRLINNRFGDGEHIIAF